MFTKLKSVLNNLVESVKLFFDEDYNDWKNFNPQFHLGNYERFGVNVYEFKTWK